MNGPGNGYYVTPAMVEQQAAAMRVKAKESRMKPLREWIQVERAKWLDTPICEPKNDPGCRAGWLNALDHVLKELKAREEAERERVNENVNALNRYAGDLLDKKEGGAK